MDGCMDFSDYYGKFWKYSQRQWANLGVKFRKGTTFIDDEYIIECLQSNKDGLGYVCLFIQIMILKNELAHNKFFTSGMRPELLYDRWTWKITKLPSYVLDETGNIKKSVKKQPYTHILNTHLMWMRQLAHEVRNVPGKYENRSSEIYDKTVLLEPQKLNEWVEKCSEEWISQWVYIPDEIVDEDKEINQET